jgi:MFS family permease
MNAATTDTSIWLALRNPAFRNLWLATVISGVCVAAHNTAAFSVFGQLDDSAFLISLMSTLSALPFALFTLPAGAFADMVDRKKILCAVNLWQALIALGLTILGLTHYLNPYIILASTFLFNLGFAFGSPASSSVVTEMVSREELASANTLGGLQINISGMIGPVLGGLLIPIMGVSFVFGANGLGFLLMFLAILQWRQARAQAPVPLDEFFATMTTAIQYVRYAPGIKVVLARSALFSFFISIIPALLPVVGLKELHLDPANLGYLFTSMGVGSVVGAVFVIPWARARFSPNTLTIYANLLLVLNLFLMANVHRPALFFAGCCNCRRGVDLVFFRTLDRGPTRDARLGTRTHERNNNHDFTGCDCSRWRNLGRSGCEEWSRSHISRGGWLGDPGYGRYPCRPSKAALD